MTQQVTLLLFLLIGNIWLIVSQFFFAYRKYLFDCQLDVIVLCILGLKYALYIKKTFVMTSHTILLLSVFSPNAGKYEPEITPYLDTFQAVVLLLTKFTFGANSTSSFFVGETYFTLIFFILSQQLLLLQQLLPKQAILLKKMFAVLFFSHLQRNTFI